MQIRKADKHMQTSLRGITKKAKEDQKHRFGNLYGLLNKRNLRECFYQLNRKAVPGVDEIDWATYEVNLEGNIETLVEALKGNKYKAKLIRRHYIPKEGGRRPLGIPVVGDKLLQAEVALILSAIYEEDFLDCSHGYRRGKGPQKAALELSKRIHRGRYRWVVDADIKGFFDSINHEWMLKILELRINDKKLLGLIRKWLKAGILEEDGKVIYPLTGTPQGGSVSAVLANIYLHYVLDLWFEVEIKPHCEGDTTMMRYADDYVCCFQYYSDAKRFYGELSKRLAKFNLELSKEKTRLIKFTRFETKDNKSFNFLGFEFRWGLSRVGKPLVKMLTSKKKFKLSLKKMKNWIRQERCKLGTAAIMKKLKQKLQGYWNYYGVCGNSARLQEYFYHVKKIVFKWMNRRSQRKSCNWGEFERLLDRYKIPCPRIIAYWN